MQTRIGENGVTLCKFMHQPGAESVGLRHGACRVVCIGEIASRESRLIGLMSRLGERCRDLLLHFCHRIIGEGMAEVLHNVEPVSAADHTQPDHVKGRVEQVCAMRRRLHEMLMGLRGIEIERNVFAFLI